MWVQAVRVREEKAEKDRLEGKTILPKRPAPVLPATKLRKEKTRKPIEMRVGKAKRVTSSHAHATAVARACATAVCATATSADTAKTARACCALTPALATGCAYKEAFVTAILAGLGSTALCEAARLLCYGALL